MTVLKTHSWEVAHTTTLIAAVAILTVTVHLIGTPRPQTPLSTASPVSPSPSTPMVPAQSLTAAHPSHVSPKTDTVPAEPSDPHVITVGATGISNRYTLLHIDRKPISPTHDALTIRLRVESLAMENLVSPFESDMLELTAPNQAPIRPMTPFRHPIPGGNSRNQDVVFKVPTVLALNHATLQIHWYNYQNELALAPPPAAGSD
jgi:hypothetical protein